MKRLLLVGLMVVSACGPTVKAGPAVTPSASPSSATATASAGHPPGTLACTLPLAQAVPPPDNSHRWSVRGAFVNFPAGDLSIDPNGSFTDIPDGRLKSLTQPYLYGGEAGATYTRRFGRWLPAKIAAVSPDSSHYAYIEYIPAPTRQPIPAPYRRIHVVDVGSGVDHVIYDEGSSPIDQGGYGIISYESEGLYLVITSFPEGGNGGLWLLDPNSGSLQQIAPRNKPTGSRHGFYLIGAGAAWYGDVAPGDQDPPGRIDPMDEVVRFDLTSRVATPWFRRPGTQVQAIGFDLEGHLIVTATTEVAGGAIVELWLVSGPAVARQIYRSSKLTEFDGYFGSPLSDSHGVWFGTSAGVFLATPDGKFQKVSAVAGEVAGRCS